MRSICLNRLIQKLNYNMLIAGDAFRLVKPRSGVLADNYLVIIVMFGQARDVQKLSRVCCKLAAGSDGQFLGIYIYLAADSGELLEAEVTAADDHATAASSRAPGREDLHRQVCTLPRPISCLLPCRSSSLPFLDNFLGLCKVKKIN